MFKKNVNDDFFLLLLLVVFLSLRFMFGHGVSLYFFYFGCQLVPSVSLFFFYGKQLPHNFVEKYRNDHVTYLVYSFDMPIKSFIRKKAHGYVMLTNIRKIIIIIFFFSLQVINRMTFFTLLVALGCVSAIRSETCLGQKELSLISSIESTLNTLKNRLKGKVLNFLFCYVYMYKNVHDYV